VALIEKCRDAYQEKLINFATMTLFYLIGFEENDTNEGALVN